MPDKSSYLQYLPSVLWDNASTSSAFSLGTMLLVFEKILTGLDDAVVIQQGNHEHKAVEEVIAKLYQLLDPWLTPSKFLVWLASLVGLELQDNWDEYQRRKAIAEITQIYWQRGLKTSLSQYLALYTVTETRPRISIDNGNKILYARPRSGQSVPVYSLVSQGQFIQSDPVPYTGLIRPSCIAAADGSLFVGDQGTGDQDIQEGNLSFKVKSQVWRISPTGSYTFSSPPNTQQFIPQPISPADWQLEAVVAIAVRSIPPSDRSQEVYVLDSNGKLYQLVPPQIKSIAQIDVVSPIAMAVDTDKNLLILDQGEGADTPKPPKIIKVELPSLKSTPHNLTTVINPLSMLVQPNGNLIIGDGRMQQPPTGKNLLSPTDLSGNLVLVDRSKDPNWTESPLLTDPHPLVAPRALVQEDDTHVLVLDVGLKPFIPDDSDPFVSQVAEQAAIYRVGLPTATVTLAAKPGNFVYPTGMASSGGSLFICDPGLPKTTSPGGISPLVYRLSPHEFGVFVQFCIHRLPQDEQGQSFIKRAILNIIRKIVDQEKPAHTLYQLVTNL